METWKVKRCMGPFHFFFFWGGGHDISANERPKSTFLPPNPQNHAQRGENYSCTQSLNIWAGGYEILEVTTQPLFWHANKNLNLGLPTFLLKMCLNYYIGKKNWWGRGGREAVPHALLSHTFMEIWLIELDWGVITHQSLIWPPPPPPPPTLPV